MTEDIHIASLVAEVSVNKVQEISAVIGALPYVEVPVSDKGGKLVILIDAPSMRVLVEITEDIRDLEGVISLLPVYQHDEADPIEEDQKQIINIGLEKRI
ncbi:MAG: chaperone NapD [Sneathiella sp.]